MLSCKYPSRRGLDKLPCVLEHSTTSITSDLFINIHVSVFDQSIYMRTVAASSALHCAVMASLTESLGFVFNDGEPAVCLLHSYTPRCREKRRRYLPNGSRLMFCKGKSLFSSCSNDAIVLLPVFVVIYVTKELVERCSGWYL